MGLLDVAVAAKIKKASEEREKAKNQLEASTFNEAALKLAMQSGDPEAIKSATTITDAIGNKSSDASKVVLSTLEARIKDKIDFRQSLDIERFKATTAAGNNIIKALAERGGTFSDGTAINTESLQEFSIQNSNRALSELNIGNRVKQNTTFPGSVSSNAPTGLTNFLKQPIPSEADVEVEKRRKLNQADIEKKEIEGGRKLTTAVKRLSLLNKQYNEALPTLDKSSIEQRLSGNIDAIAAKWGVKPNAKLLAILSNSRPIAINLIRAFGEVGNLSESEQKGALEVVDQAGLTEDERLDKVKQFAEFALAGTTPESLKAMMDDPQVLDIVKTLGIEVPGYNNKVSSETSSQKFDKEKEARYQAFKKKQLEGK